jgi:hypothetical protein
MSRTEGHDRLSDDARFELSVAAMSHERRNRPLGIVVVALVAVILAVLYAGYGWSSRNAALASLKRAVNDEAAVEMLATEWKRLEQAERDPVGRVGRPIPTLLSRMEELAVQAGMDKPRPPRIVPRDQRGGITVKEYHYGEPTNPVVSPSLSAMLEWLRLAQGEELNMELIGLNLRPDPNNWRMTVTFRRWERAG